MPEYKHYMIDGQKAVNMNNLPEEAWQIISGGYGEESDLESFRKSVPWLFRGVQKRANAVAGMPFVILDGEREIDTSGTYANALGWWKDPHTTLWLIEACLTVHGRAYFHKERNLLAMLGLKYLLPTSVVPKITKTAGLTYFERKVGAKSIRLETEEMLYFWGLDETVEIGPPRSSPAHAAVAAAGVLFNIDEFARLFFERGAIKAAILSVPKNTAPEERARLKKWYQRVITGIKNAFATEVVNADDVKPVVVGEGIKELSNVELTKEKREDIATALDIPQTLLFDQSANFATARQSDKRFADSMVIEVKFIERVLNDQLFAPFGFRIEFRPETKQIFQEEEVNRSAALVNLERAGIPPWLGSKILGFDLPSDIDWEALEQAIVEYQEHKSSLRPAFGGSDNGDNGPLAVNTNEPDPTKAMLDQWERHAIKAYKDKRPIKGTAEAPKFDHEGTLSPGIVVAIGTQLDRAKSADDIRRIFRHAIVWERYP